MNKETMLEHLPPVFERVQSGWTYFYTHVYACDDKGKGIISGYGKLMVRYSDDFCGGAEVRSVDISVTKPRYGNSWGWERSFCGMSMRDNRDLYEAVPDAKFVHRVPLEILTDSNSLKELIYTSLALAVNAYAGSGNRAGIIARDKVDGRVHTLMQHIAKVSTWKDATLVKYRSNSAGYGYKVKFPSIAERHLSSIPYFNVNSDNPVAVFVAYWENSYDEDYDDDDCYDDREYHTGSVTSRVYTLNNVDKRRVRALEERCPSSGWSCG